MTDASPTLADVRIRGGATAVEVAAVIAVLTSAGLAPAAPAPTRSRWADPTHGLRAAPTPGPGAWRRSALPH